jgi:hypothetical protein
VGPRRFDAQGLRLTRATRLPVVRDVLTPEDLASIPSGEFDRAEEEVTQQRKSLAEQGPTRKVPPEELRELGERVRENAVVYARYKTLGKIDMLWLKHMSKHAPEDCARLELAKVAGERAEDAAAGRKPRERMPILTPEAVRGMREWLDRYAKAVEGGSRPGLRKVK